jgi:uncharacterized phage protein (TIGR02220 family)
MSIEDINLILDYFKTQTQNAFNYAEAQNLIKALIEKGHTLEDFKKVTLLKVAQWKGTEYEQYIRPQTLFGQKFTKYLNEQPRNPKDTISKLSDSVAKAQQFNWRMDKNRR